MTKQRRTPTSRLFGLGALALGVLASPRPAAAWDPSTTHQGLLESAVVRSALHLRWMDASELERGLFSSLRLDPSLLDPDELRLLQLAVAGAHADTGAQPLGGPGACPSADAPPETQQFCVDRDLWEHSALGWIRLGIIAEVTPPARHLHHFIDLDHPDQLSWADEELPPLVLRSRQARANGEPMAGVVTGTNFSGEAQSALAWFEDPDDILAPPATFRHLARASLAETRAEREHHLAFALLGVGALVHVIQDLSVPAHARGDATAFFAQLSPAPGDRGLPLQEFVRIEYGRVDLPGLVAPSGRPDGVPLAETLLGHVLGGSPQPQSPQFDGVARLAAGHFFSEASVPAPKHVDPQLSAGEAATVVLGDQHGLDRIETDGATLSPWPATEGYLLSPTGRALAAFDTDLEGRIRLYLDEVCYRDQANLLLPVAVDATRSILDLLWPAWPQMQRSGDAVTLTIPPAEGFGAWASAKLTVMIERDDGQRRQIGEHTLAVGGDNRIELGAGALVPGERVVLVLEATRVEGPPIVLEQLLVDAPVQSEAPAKVVPVEPAPVEPAPVEPEAEPATAEPAEPIEPDTDAE